MDNSEALPSDNSDFADMWQLESGASEGIGDLWDKLLTAVEAAAGKSPQVKSDPESLEVKDIRARVQREFMVDLSHRNEETLNTQSALQNLLEECLCRHPKNKQVVTAARLPEAVNLFPRYPDKALNELDAIEQVFRRFMLENGRQKAFGGYLSAQAKAGLLILSLVLRQGICSMRILCALLQALEQPLRLAGHWLYLHITLGGDARHPPEHRRIFLDIVSAALYIRLARDCAEVLYPDKLRELKQAKANRQQATLIKRCYLAFLKEATTDNGKHCPDTAQALLHCRAEALRLDVNPVLSEYACGSLRSTSFAEGDWLRWLGLRAADGGSGGESAEENANTSPGVTTIPEQTARNSLDHMFAADFDISGELASIRKVLKKRRPRLECVNALQTIVDNLRVDQGEQAPITLLAKWTLSLLAEKRSKGKYLQVSTVKYMLGIFGARMLAGFAECVDRVPDEDELHDIYLWIIEQAASGGHESNLAMVIRDFDRFLSSELGRDSGASLEGLPASVGHYQVSAHAISPREFADLIRMINGPASTILSEAGKKKTSTIVTLAYRIGLRRAEVLGIESSDVHESRSPELLVRDNQFRGMKTANARRRTPLGLLKDEECQALLGLTAGLADDDAVFRHGLKGQPVADHKIIPQTKRMLLEVTGDPSIHFHHLRHAAASWYFFALIAEQVRVHRYYRSCPFLETLVAYREKAETHLLSRFHPIGSRAYAVCELLGHGSPVTTFAHYIHVLDLLLFMGVDPSDKYGDMQLQLAALMMSERSRIGGYLPAEALQSLVAKYPERVIVHLPLPEKSMETTTVSKGFPLHFEVLETRWEKATSEGASINGIKPADSGLVVPAPGALRQAAAQAIAYMNKAIAEFGKQAEHAIVVLAAKRLKNSDWSSVDHDELFQILEGFSGTVNQEAMDHFEVQQVIYAPGKKRRLQRLDDLEQLKKIRRRKKRDGKFRLRLRDIRTRSSAQRPKAQDRKRQKAQAGVTWAVLAAAISVSQMG